MLLSPWISNPGGCPQESSQILARGKLGCCRNDWEAKRCCRPSNRVTKSWRIICGSQVSRLVRGIRGVLKAVHMPPAQVLLKKTHRLEKQLADLAQALGPSAVAALDSSETGSDRGDHGACPPPLPSNLSFWDRLCSRPCTRTLAIIASLPNPTRVVVHDHPRSSPHMSECVVRKRGLPICWHPFT